MKLYIASLLALRLTECHMLASHTVASCESNASIDDVRQKLLYDAMQLYPTQEGYTKHDVVVVELGYNALEGMMP